MTVDLKRAREIAWHFAERAHGTLYEKAGVNFISIETEFELANTIRDLVDEIDHQKNLVMLYQSMAVAGPGFAEALERSAQAGKLWKEGLVQKTFSLQEEVNRLKESQGLAGVIDRKDAEIEHFQYTINRLMEENVRLRESLVEKLQSAP